MSSATRSQLLLRLNRSLRSSPFRSGNQTIANSRHWNRCQSTLTSKFNGKWQNGTQLSNKYILQEQEQYLRQGRFLSTTNEKEDEEKNNETLEKESMDFKAETRQLLDIVTHSLYTDKEIFLRELVSNASDALEKLRHVQTTGDQGSIVDPDLPLEIRIETDELNNTLTISDTGIGLTKEDMIMNLGTIARSGSKAFVKAVSQQNTGGDSDSARGIIGKFGVGFYSAFMVGKSVDVRSLSSIQSEKEENNLAHVWSSMGSGSFDISRLSSDVRQNRGSSIVINLKEDEVEFCDEKRIESILKKYSNFVNFPILLNGNRVNTMEAVWAKDPKEVDEKTHSEFYKFISNGFDEPLTRLHFRADAPLEIKALFYVPSFHTEKHGMGRMESSVSLYSRKVMIASNGEDILPEWLRFVKGVVDSEDLPLSLSREKPQDTALMSKLRKVLTRKFVSHLTTMARKEPDKYKEEFYNEYSFFLKEGICQDFEVQEQLSKLLYFETSKTMNGELSSFEEYISRCKPEQNEIYYLVAPSRQLALASPYLETFEKSGIEVILVYSAIDDFVMNNLQKFSGRTLISAEKGGLDLGDDNDEDEKQDDESKESSDSNNTLSTNESNEFCAWFKLELSDKIESCKVTNRLGASPAVVTDHESGALRRMMRMVDTQNGSNEVTPLPKQTVEINPKHPVIVGLNEIRKKEPTLAKVCAEQVFDNCLVAAGLLDDGRSMLPRLNGILESLVKGAAKVSESKDKKE